ncbi:MAG: VTT domain-containing protein [Acidobacteriota bacterium]
MEVAERTPKGALLATGALLIAAGTLYAIDPGAWQRLTGLLERSGPWGEAAFVLIFALATVLAVPALLLMTLAVTAFGFQSGLLLSLLGGSLGAVAAFAVARRLGRAAVAQRLADSRWRTVDRALARHGGWAVLLFRLLPILPFNLLNYLCGLTAIRFRHYLLATVVGILPGALVYCHAAAQLPDLAAGRPNPLGIATALLLLAALWLLVPALAHHFGGEVLADLADSEPTDEG